MENSMKNQTDTKIIRTFLAVFCIILCVSLMAVCLTIGRPADTAKAATAKTIIVHFEDMADEDAFEPYTQTVQINEGESFTVYDSSYFKPGFALMGVYYSGEINYAKKCITPTHSCAVMDYNELTKNVTEIYYEFSKIWDEGAGTSEDPYIIKGTRGLNALIRGYSDTKDKYYSYTGDAALTSDAYNLPAFNPNGFEGNIDFNNSIIRINATYFQERDNVTYSSGMFPIVNSGTNSYCTIKNLIIDEFSSDKELDYRFTNVCYGNVVGTAYNTRIENVIDNVALDFDYECYGKSLVFGGICGKLCGTVDMPAAMVDCANAESDTRIHNNGVNSIIGGLAGEAEEGILINCCNRDTAVIIISNYEIVDNVYVCGLIGCSKNTKIYNCCNEAYMDVGSYPDITIYLAGITSGNAVMKNVYASYHLNIDGMDYRIVPESERNYNCYLAYLMVDSYNTKIYNCYCYYVDTMYGVSTYFPHDGVIKNDSKPQTESTYGYTKIDLYDSYCDINKLERLNDKIELLQEELDTTYGSGIYSLKQWYESCIREGSEASIPEIPVVKAIGYRRGDAEGGERPSTTCNMPQRVTPTDCLPFTKRGYTQIGWKHADGTPFSDDYNSNVMDELAYPIWAPETYEVTLNENGGTYEADYTEPTSYTYGTAVTLPTGTEITRTGYEFLGWTATDNVEDVAYITEISSEDTGDKEFYAQWEEQVIYAVTLNENEGTYAADYTEPTSYTYGTAVTLPTGTDITRVGYEFLGWTATDSEEDVAYITEISEEDTGDKEFYAKWTPATYAVTLNENEGTYAADYTEPTSYIYGAVVTLPTGTNITRVGYEFLGWTATNDVEDVAYMTEIPASETGEKSYYAKWTPATYAVTLNENEGTYAADYTEPTSYTYGTAVTLPTGTDITRVGYIFLGWTATNDVEDVAYITEISAESTGNMEFYAKWMINAPTIENAIGYSDVYDGANHTISVTANSLFALSYQWYKGGIEENNIIAGATSNVYTVKNVADNAQYFCLVTATAGNDTNVAWSSGIAVNITKGNAVINVDQTAIVKTFGDEWTLPAATSNLGEVICNKTAADLADVNTYTVTYSVAETDNYFGDSKTVNVTINKQQVAKPAADTAIFIADGGVKNYAIAEDGRYIVSGNEKTEFGNYTVTVSLIDAASYEWADGTADNLSYSFIIRKPAVADKIEDDAEDDSVIVIDEDGFTPETVVKIDIVPHSNTGLYNGHVKNNEKVSTVYNVQLLVDGQSVSPDGATTLKIQIPNECVGKEFRLLHVYGDTVTEMEYTIDGNYAVFTAENLGEFIFVADDTGSILWLIILLAILLALEIVLAAYKLIKNHKSGKQVKAYSFAPILLAAFIPVSEIAVAIILGVLCLIFLCYDIYLLTSKKRKNNKKKAMAESAADTAVSDN